MRPRLGMRRLPSSIVIMKRISSVVLASCLSISAAGFLPRPSNSVRAQSSTPGQNINWTALVNCVASGSSVQKISGRDDTYDASATSLQEISGGEAFIEFTAGDSNKALFCGLTNDSSGSHFDDIEFAIKLTSFSVAEVRESNVYRGETPYARGDVFRIAVQGGQVAYYKNGSLFFAGGKQPRFPLRAQVALQSINARIDAASIGAATVETDADWKAYQHDPTHSGYSVASNVGSANAAGLAESWSFETGGWITGTPIVASGVVYIGSWDGHMYALRESDGGLIWSYDAGTISVDRCQTSYGIDSTAALSGNRLYFGNGAAQLFALNAGTGELVWRTQLADPNLAFHLWGSPTVQNGKIYVGLASHCVNPCVAGRLVCVDASNGRVLWTFAAAPEGSTGGAVWSSAAVDADRSLVFVGTGNYCTGEDTHSTAIVALNADTGALVWEFKKLHSDLNNLDFGASPCLFESNGKPALAIPCKDGHCYALNRVTGELLWDTVVSDGDSRGGSISSPAAAFGKIYLGATVHITSGKVAALDQRDGHIVWERALDRPVLGAAAVAGGAVFFGGDDGKLHAYDVSSGDEIWNAQRNSMLGGVSISRNSVFVGSLDQHVYSFALPGSTAPAKLTISVTSPGSNDVWIVKRKNNINWTCSQAIARVDVSISRDGGETWSMLSEGVSAASGTIRVKIKKPRTESAIIKVADSDDSSVFGTTGVFRIR